jgi:hypothetical protein
LDRLPAAVSPGPHRLPRAHHQARTLTAKAVLAHLAARHLEAWLLATYGPLYKPLREHQQARLTTLPVVRGHSAPGHNSGSRNSTSLPEVGGKATKSPRLGRAAVRQLLLVREDSLVDEQDRRRGGRRLQANEKEQVNSYRLQRVADTVLNLEHNRAPLQAGHVPAAATALSAGPAGDRAGAATPAGPPPRRAGAGAFRAPPGAQRLRFLGAGQLSPAAGPGLMALMISKSLASLAILPPRMLAPRTLVPGVPQLSAVRTAHAPVLEVQLLQVAVPLPLVLDLLPQLLLLPLQVPQLLLRRLRPLCLPSQLLPRLGQCPLRLAQLAPH